MPDRGATPASPDAPVARFRRALPGRVEAAARRLLRTGPNLFDSQAAFLRAIRKELSLSDPLARIGAKRLRRVLIEAGAVRFRVVYTERADRHPLTRCPVCGEGLTPIRNRTLLGDDVTLGYRCHRCGYWTHLKRRVPRRYSVSPGVPTGPRSG